MRRWTVLVLLIVAPASGAAACASEHREVDPPAATSSATAAATPLPGPSAVASDSGLRFNTRAGSAMRRIGWHPEGKAFATYCGRPCDDAKGPAAVRVLVWSYPDLRLRAELEPNPDDMGNGRIYRVLWSPDGTRLAVTTHNEATLWNADSGALIARIGAAAVYGGINFSHDSKYLAVSSVFGLVQVAEASSGKTVIGDRLHDGSASYSAGMHWLKDGRLLAEGNTRFGVFDPKTGATKLRVFATLDQEEGSMELDATETQLVVHASRACVGQVHDTKTLALKKKLTKTCMVALSPTGVPFAAVLADGAVTIAAGGPLGAATVVRPAPGAGDPAPRALRFSPDGKWLFWTVGENAGVWDVEKGRMTATVPPPVTGGWWESNAVVSVMRDPEGERFDVVQGRAIGSLSTTVAEGTPFPGLTVEASGDLTFRRADGAELRMRAVHDGAWRTAVLDPAGRADGDERLIASDVYDVAKGGGAPVRLEPGLAASFFATVGKRAR